MSGGSLAFAIKLNLPPNKNQSRNGFNKLLLNAILKLEHQKYHTVWLSETQISQATLAAHKATLEFLISNTSKINIGLDINLNFGLELAPNTSLNPISRANYYHKLMQKHKRLCIAINTEQLSNKVVTAHESYELIAEHLTLLSESSAVSSKNITVQSGTSALAASLANEHNINMGSTYENTTYTLNALRANWEIYNRTSKQMRKQTGINHGHHQVKNWSLSIPMHLAPTKLQARDAVDFGFRELNSEADSLGLDSKKMYSHTAQEMVDAGVAIIDTPKAAVKQLRDIQAKLIEFNTFILCDRLVVSASERSRSQALFAAHVIPNF